jgi:hypothetical protein
MFTEPNYKQAMHHAWRMIWDHKLLWPLGLFATLLGQMGFLEMTSKFLSALSQKNSYESWGNLPAIFVSTFKYIASVQLPFSEWIWSIWLWIILIGIALVFLFVSVISQGTLVHTTSQKHKFQVEPDISKAWHISVGHFGRLLSVHFIRKIVIIGLTILVGMGTTSAINQSSAISTLALIVILLSSLTLGFIVSCVGVYTVGYIVVEEQSLKESFLNAWALFKQHLLVSFEVGFLVLLGNILLLVLLIAGGAILLTPAFLMILLLYFSSLRVVFSVL